MVSVVHHRGPRGSQWVLRVPHGSTGTGSSPRPASPEGVVGAVLALSTVLADQADAAFAPIRTWPRCWDGAHECRTRRCRECLIRCTQRACSGTGKPILRVELSRSAIAKHVEYALTMPAGFSTHHLYPIQWCRAPRGSNDVTAFNSSLMPTGPRSIVASIPTPECRNDHLLGPRLLGGRRKSLRGSAAPDVNMMMEEGRPANR